MWLRENRNAARPPVRATQLLVTKKTPPHITEKSSGEGFQTDIANVQSSEKKREMDREGTTVCAQEERWEDQVGGKGMKGVRLQSLSQPEMLVWQKRCITDSYRNENPHQPSVPEVLGLN